MIRSLLFGLLAVFGTGLAIAIPMTSGWIAFNLFHNHGAAMFFSLCGFVVVAAAWIHFLRWVSK